MSDQSPRLGLRFLFEGQGSAIAEHTRAMYRLDALTDPRILTRTNTPPGSPADGDGYIVLGSPTGVFVGHANQLAFYLNGEWVFIAPQEGMQAFIADEQDDAGGRLAYYNGSAWKGVAQRAFTHSNFSGTFSASPTESEVQALADAIDLLINNLRNNGTMNDD